MKTVLQHASTGMSQVTAYQRCTSLNMGKKLVPEWSSGADKRSHGGVIWYASMGCVEKF